MACYMRCQLGVSKGANPSICVAGLKALLPLLV